MNSVLLPPCPKCWDNGPAKSHTVLQLRGLNAPRAQSYMMMEMRFETHCLTVPKLRLHGQGQVKWLRLKPKRGHGKNGESPSKELWLCIKPCSPYLSSIATTRLTRQQAHCLSILTSAWRNYYCARYTDKSTEAAKRTIHLLSFK